MATRAVDSVAASILSIPPLWCQWMSKLSLPTPEPLQPLCVPAWDGQEHRVSGLEVFSPLRQDQLFRGRAKCIEGCVLRNIPLTQVPPHKVDMMQRQANALVSLPHFSHKGPQPQ